MKPRSHESGCYNDGIALTFDRHLGSTAAAFVHKRICSWIFLRTYALNILMISPKKYVLDNFSITWTNADFSLARTYDIQTRNIQQCIIHGEYWHQHINANGCFILCLNYFASLLKWFNRKGNCFNILVIRKYKRPTVLSQLLLAFFCWLHHAKGFSVPCDSNDILHVTGGHVNAFTHY